MNLQPIPVIPDSLYVNDPEAVYKFAPNTKATVYSEDGITTEISTNSLGLWEDLEPPYPESTILVLGDSFTHGSYCCDLEETYPKQLQRSLKAAGKDYYVINSGIPGYGPKNEVDFLKKYYPIIKPRLVVLTVYEENDLQDMDPPGKYKVVDGHITEAIKYAEETKTLPKRLVFETKGFLYRNSAGYRVVYDFITGRFFPEKSTAYKTLLMYTESGKEMQAKNLLSAETEYLEYKEFCSEKNIACVVYLAPSRTQFTENSTKLALSNGINENLDLLWVQDSLGRFFQDKNMTYYDLAVSFRERGSPRDMYLPRNIHWNEEGSRVAGEYLAGKLINDSLV